MKIIEIINNVTFEIISLSSCLFLKIQKKQAQQKLNDINIYLI